MENVPIRKYILIIYVYYIGTYIITQFTYLLYIYIISVYILYYIIILHIIMSFRWISDIPCCIYIWLMVIIIYKSDFFFRDFSILLHTHIIYLLHMICAARVLPSCIRRYILFLFFLYFLCVLENNSVGPVSRTSP